MTRATRARPGPSNREVLEVRERDSSPGSLPGRPGRPRVDGGRAAADRTIGQVQPEGPEVAAAAPNGHRVRYEVVNTPRGDEVRVDAGSGSGRSVLTVRLR